MLPHEVPTRGKPYYIDAHTRIVYGISIPELGTTYELQRKVKCLWFTRWKKRTWAYTFLFENGNELKRYLLSLERDLKPIKLLEIKRPYIETVLEKFNY